MRPLKRNTIFYMASQLLFEMVVKYQSVMDVKACKTTLVHIYRYVLLAGISALPLAAFFYPDRHISWLRKYGWVRDSR